MMPSLARMEKRFRANGLRVIGISLDTEKKAMEDFVREVQMTWPQYFDGHKWDNAIARKFGIRTIPMTVIIGRKGKVRAVQLFGGKLVMEVREALAGRPSTPQGRRP